MKIGRCPLILSLVLALSLGSLALAQAPKLNPIGTWTGKAENQGNFDDITIIIEKKDNNYTGKITDAMGMFPGVEIKNFVWKDNKVTFEFPGSMGGMTFNLKAELTLTEKTMDGTWTMVEDGSTGTLALNKQ